MIAPRLSSRFAPISSIEGERLVRMRDEALKAAQQEKEGLRGFWNWLLSWTS